MRRGSLLALLLLWSGAARADGVLVASNAEHTLTLLDAATLRPVARFPTGLHPHEVAVSPDQRFAYVANAGTPDRPGNSITVVDLARREVAATWEVGEHQPHDLRVSRDGELVWAACGRTRAVLEIDADDGSIARTFETGVDGGWMLTAAPDDSRIYVAHLEGGAVSIIDRASGKVVTHTLEPNEMGMDVSPDGREVWVASLEKSRLTVLEGDRVAASFASGGEEPMRVRFTPDGKRVLVAHRRSLVVFDRARRTPIATIPLPAPAKILSVARDGKRAYLSSPSQALLMVVELAARRVVATVPVGKTPDGIAVVGEPGPYAARVAFTIPEADLVPEGIAHDPATGTFYVSSTYKRKIVAVGKDGAVRDFTTEAQDGLLGVVGMKVDPARRVLWAAASDAGQNMPMKGMRPESEGRTGVWKYDLATGKLLQSWLIGDGKEKHFLNDLVLHPSGDVFITDSATGAIYVVRDGELQRWLPDGSLARPNGIARSDDGRTLYVSVRGGVATVDVASRRVGRVEGAATFADGLYQHRGSLVAVQPWAQGHVVEALRLAPSRDRVAGTRVLEGDNPEHLQPTTGVVVGDELFYIANSQLQHFRKLHQPDGTFPMLPLRPIVVLRVRL